MAYGTNNWGERQRLAREQAREAKEAAREEARRRGRRVTTSYSGGIHGLGTIIDPNALPLLSVGARGPLVASLQRQLAQWGENPGPADGIFGPRTEAALKTIQRILHVPETGRVDNATIAAMKVDLGSRGSVLLAREAQSSNAGGPTSNSTVETVTSYDGGGGSESTIPWKAIGIGVAALVTGFIVFGGDDEF